MDYKAGLIKLRDNTEMKMQEEEIRAHFLELRTKGMSFHDIAFELKTTEEELLRLAKKLQENVKKSPCGC